MTKDRYGTVKTKTITKCMGKAETNQNKKFYEQKENKFLPGRNRSTSFRFWDRAEPRSLRANLKVKDPKSGGLSYVVCIDMNLYVVSGLLLKKKLKRQPTMKQGTT